MGDPNAEELRVEAKRLYAEARQIENEYERLIVVLRALELELQADARDRGHDSFRAPRH
jgi:hypothetical protein